MSKSIDSEQFQYEYHEAHLRLAWDAKSKFREKFIHLVDIIHCTRNVLLKVVFFKLFTGYGSRKR